MKKLSAIILLCLPYPCAGVASFLLTRPAYNNIAAYMSLWHDAWFDLKHHTAIEVSGQYQRSFNGHRLAEGYLMNSLQSLTVRGSTNPQYTAPDTNIDADWLGLPTDFEGTLSIKPEQWQMCWSISARRSFAGIVPYSFFDYMWAFIDLPLVVAHNNINFSQSDVSGAGNPDTSAVYDILSAFNNPEWNYQKIPTNSLTRTCLGHLRLGIGSTFISDERAELAFYSALSIPTNRVQNNEFMFEPQPGFNGHTTLVLGTAVQLPLTRPSYQKVLSLYFELENNFLIHNHQWRTFDLLNNEWSRYVLIRQQNQLTNTTIPGVNILTQRVQVKPHSLLDVAGGLRGRLGVLEGEIGFGVWGRHVEQVRLHTPFPQGYGIAGSTTNTSASMSTISFQAANDTTFTPILGSDLDPASAASPGALIWRVHTALGAFGNGEKGSALIGGGAFIEIANIKATGVCQWGLWVKAGGAF